MSLQKRSGGSNSTPRHGRSLPTWNQIDEDEGVNPINNFIALETVIDQRVSEPGELDRRVKHQYRTAWAEPDEEPEGSRTHRVEET